MGQSKDFTTKMPYIARDPLYEVEKLYSTDFKNGSPDNPACNHKFNWTPIVVKDIVDRKAFDLNTHGFCLKKARTALSTIEALANKQAMEDSYANEVEALLHHHFPEYSRIETMNVIVRKRDPRYPVQKPTLVSHQQPGGVPHSDFSLGGLPLQIDHSFPGQWAHLEGKDFDMLNVWRPLEGPNDDWPLALCDFNSIEEDDIIINDDIHRDRVVESSLLHSNTAHRWFYVSGQTVEDILIFRTIDSTGKRARGFHGAVENPLAPPGQLRSSIEIRVVAIR